MDLVTNAQAHTIIVTFPKLTKEVRDELSKEVSRAVDETKGRLRSVRQQAINRLKYAGLTDDDVRDAKEAIQDLLVYIYIYNSINLLSGSGSLSVCVS